MNMKNTRRELTPQEVKMLALVVLASSSYPSMQSKDPQPIVSAWSLMLADIPLEILQAAVLKVCRESEAMILLTETLRTTRSNSKNH